MKIMRLKVECTLAKKLRCVHCLTGRNGLNVLEGSTAFWDMQRRMPRCVLIQDAPAGRRLKSSGEQHSVTSNNYGSLFIPFGETKTQKWTLVNSLLSHWLKSDRLETHGNSTDAWFQILGSLITGMIINIQQVS